MGTRSTTKIFDDGKFLVGIYRQMDGYPEGHGKDLSEFLCKFSISNGVEGFGTYAKKDKANGIDELAALMVYSFKKDNINGNIYLTTEHDSQEWDYEIRLSKDGYRIKTFNDGEIKFDGNLHEFVCFVNGKPVESKPIVSSEADNLLKEFETTLAKSTAKAYSKLSLERPLSDEQAKKFKEACKDGYGIEVD